MIKARRRATWVAGIVMVAIACAAMRGRCADSPNTTDPLLDLFIKKGFVTQKEAEQVEAEAQALRTNEAQMPPLPQSSWIISKGIKRVGLFGDVRLRYEDRSVEDPGGKSIDLQRFRYSVRVGLRGEALDHFYYGLRLDTAPNPRSAWVTLGSSASGTPYQGPFGKSTAGINIGQAYIGWQPWDWVNLTVGKMPNPLYTTPMVWDSDINPEGLAERFKYTVGHADLFVTFGQFLYQNMTPSSASANLGFGSVAENLNNIFQFAWQGGVNYHFSTNTSATFAPTSAKIAATLYNYTGLQRSSYNTFSALAPYFGDPYIGEGAFYLQGGPPTAQGYSGYGTSGTFPGYGSVGFPLNQVGLNHLLVVEVPFAFNFKISRLDARVFGDVACNLEGAQRAEAAAAAYQAVSAQTIGAIPHSFSPQKNDNKAYQIGFAIGSHDSLGLVNGRNSRKHAWEIKTYWQHVEQYALDPNLIDSDFFEGRENLEGIYVAAAYSFTANLIGTFRYGHASRINKLLGTGGSNQDIPQMNPINNFDLFQVDLTLKF